MAKNLDNAKTASGWNIIAAIALFLSPFVFQFNMSGSGSTNDYIAALIVFILAIIRVSAPAKTTWASWINVILGIWLVISPFVLGFTSTAAIWTNVVLGLIIGLLAVISATQSTRYSRA